MLGKDTRHLPNRQIPLSKMDGNVSGNQNGIQNHAIIAKRNNLNVKYEAADCDGIDAEDRVLEIVGNISTIKAPATIRVDTL